MFIANHGGYCCGVKHLYDFPSGLTKAARLRLLKKRLREIFSSFSGFLSGHSSKKTWRGLVEVVLSEYQLDEWRDVVEEVGFKRVYSFLNSNSDNTCHVFLLELNRPKSR